MKILDYEYQAQALKNILHAYASTEEDELDEEQLEHERIANRQAGIKIDPVIKCRCNCGCQNEAEVTDGRRLPYCNECYSRC